MNPIAFTIFGLSIRWYGILIGTGLGLGLIIANYNSRWRDIDFDELLNVVLISFPIAILGARLYYVAFEFSYYKDNIDQILNIRQGGLAIHGGLILGIVTALIYTNRKKLNFLKMADIAAPSIIFAQAMGRWGNFFNSEAHGGAVSYDFIKHFPAFIQKGMYIDGSYYHPTFLYESLWDISVFIMLNILLRKSKKPGLVFFSYIALYSVARGIIEGLRTDSLMFGPFRVAQLISMAGVLAWVAFMVVSRKSLVWLNLIKLIENKKNK